MRIFRSIDLLWATLSMLALGSWSGLACTDLKPLDKSPGSYAWVYHTDQPIATSPVVDTDGVIYVVSGSTLHAVYDDGSPAWQFAAAAGLLVSPAVVAEPEKLVAVIDSAGTLYPLDADGPTLLSNALEGAVTRIPPVVTSTQ
ncbi:MAG: PQQ-binding-like beta-propeller repeat protein, partial [Myxococcales bacterium]|nr:PQQ-binding-like beta-propeller repeat protein [Myxococcales bacterium]